MTDTQAEAHVNGTAPAPPEAGPCEDCATSGEKVLAVLAFGFAVFIAVMAIDMFTGGKITGMVREAAQ
jgi:hypothetical protein